MHGPLSPPLGLCSLWVTASCALLLAASLTTAEYFAAPNFIYMRGPVPYDVVVRTRDGALKGEQVLGAGGSAPYYAFRGIPYAAPPLGNLRFKNPRPTVPWRAERDATREGPKCAQITVLAAQMEGEEDCLFLNVYSPNLDGPTMPVMVYIHGGGFVYGSGNAAENGPDFIVHHDVVLVTLNYRLGAMGFLNLDNDDMPGNMGLKDQRAALLWVQENIMYFGGNPNQVTIFGNSAGAASVHYHSIVPASRGLFGAAIMQSGNALAGFAYQEWNQKMAAELARQLGSNTTSPKEMADSFRRASTTEILAANLRMIQANPKLQLGYPAFGPSPERRTSGAEAKFLAQDPESLLLEPQVPPVPTVAGISGQEGYFAYYFGGLDKQPALEAALAQNVKALLPPSLSPAQDTRRVLGLQGDAAITPAQAANVAARVHEEYLAGANLTQDKKPFIKLFGDLFVGIATHRLVNLSKRNPDAPLYLYHFLEDGDYNWGKVSFNITEKGATHTDELGYLMHITSPRDLAQTFNGHTGSSKALRLLTKMWTNFAKTLWHPLPEAQYCWPAVTVDALTAPYANITGGVSLAHGLGGSRMRLWDEAYAEQRRQSIYDPTRE